MWNKEQDQMACSLARASIKSHLGLPLADKALNGDEQAAYFDAMRQLRLCRKDIEEAFQISQLDWHQYQSKFFCCAIRRFIFSTFEENQFHCADKHGMFSCFSNAVNVG